MDLNAPISTIMTTDVASVTPKDRLEAVKKLFDERKIHHVPVIRFQGIVGLISKSDFQLFQRIPNSDMDRFTEATRLKAFRAEEIMVTDLKVLSPQDPIQKAVDIFVENDFHCLPLVEGETFKGIITTMDIIKMLNKQ